MSECAPVALFAFRRPVHLTKTLEALGRNRLAAETDLFVFVDRPKAPDLEVVNQRVLDIARAAGGFRSVTVTHRERAYGLSANIVAGVSEVIAHRGRVIVVEDDLVTSPHFLEYMNQGLDVYAGQAQVASIHGWVYPVRWQLPETFFLRGADCWGWATWQDKWAAYEADGAKLLREIRAKGLSRTFNQYGTYPYEAMLEQQILGQNDSWAVRWHASCFLKGWVTLHPGRPLVLNIGHDGDGATHSAVTAQFDGLLAASPVLVRQQPARPTTRAVASLWVYHVSRKMRSLAGRVLKGIRSLDRA